MMVRNLFLGMCLIALQACGGFNAINSDGGPSNLVLNNSESTLSFVSVKNNAVAEVHRFNGLSGFLTEQDTASIDIDLASVSTGIEIRNQRMAEHLFEVSEFAKASISVAITDFDLGELRSGERLDAKLDASLNLHGLSQAVPVSVSVVRLDNGGLLVQSRQPVVINAASFGLTEGVAKLAELAALPAIANAVPVSFSLLFEKV